jgi:DNA-binding FadR family transcriptional regulator
MNTAERIYAASTSDEAAASRSAEELARRIEDDIASLNPGAGDALGSLRDLAIRYGAGRSLVREAVGLVERRGLGRMRPGPSGGLILTQPPLASVGGDIAAHLRAGLTQRQQEDAREVLALLASRHGIDEPVLRLLACSLEILGPDTDQGEQAVDAPSRSVPPATLPATIARKLAAEIFGSVSAGTRLGSEWELCERFNVSRLTLRQAIRLLQDRGLVESRRGRGNGLIVRNGSGAGTIRLMLAYLIAGRMDPATAGTILFQLNAFTPALAVSRSNAEQRLQLEAALARVEVGESFERYDLLGLVHCVSRLADSPVIDLFSRCLAAYEARFMPSLAGRLPVGAQQSYFQLVRRLLDRMPVGDTRELAWAKQESAKLMLEMSLTRPI